MQKFTIHDLERFIMTQPDYFRADYRFPRPIYDVPCLLVQFFNSKRIKFDRIGPDDASAILDCRNCFVAEIEGLPDYMIIKIHRGKNYYYEIKEAFQKWKSENLELFD